MSRERESKLFDLSYTTSKISNLIDRVRGYRAEDDYEEEELNLEDSSRWDNLKSRLSQNGNFQPAEDSEIEDIEEKLGKQFDRNDEDN